MKFEKVIQNLFYKTLKTQKNFNLFGLNFKKLKSTIQLYAFNTIILDGFCTFAQYNMVTK